MTQPQAELLQAVALHREGRLQEAEASYSRILKANPAHFDCLHLLGVLASQTGRYELAVELIGRAISLNPNQPAFHSNLGNALLELKRADEALAYFDAAIALKPDYPEARNNRGNALLELGRPNEALAAYDAAISLKPDYAEAHNNRGNALYELKRLDEALSSYGQAIVLRPGYAAAHYNRGRTLNELRRFDEALVSYEQAIAINPGFAEAYSNRGDVLLQLKRPDQALASCDRAISLTPRYAEAHNNRGNALLELKRLDEALAAYDQAIALRTDYAVALYNRGNVLLELRRANDALAAYDRAIALKPDYADAYNNRGNALYELARPDEAIASYGEAIVRQPDHAGAYSNRGNALNDAKRTDEALVCYEKAIELKPDSEFLLGTLIHAQMMLCDWRDFDGNIEKLDSGVRALKKVTSPFPLLALVDSPELHQLAAQIYADTKYPSIEQPGGFKTGGENGKIRVGYYSADFHNHPVAYLTAELFEIHDRSKFEIFGFSLAAGKRDGLRDRLTSAFDQFIDVTNQTDREIARQSRELRIDIAVDLNGFTQGGRPGIFAERCAPIQVSYLGFPGTMGAPFMDYLLADKIVVPPQEAVHFSEQIAYLPDSFQPNDRKQRRDGTVPTRAAAGLPENGFVFCSFNRAYKITPPVFDVWVRVLRSVADSVLWLSDEGQTAAQNLRQEASKRGVDPARLVFAPRLPNSADHLARHKVADLFLDTLPYNAHTTASDALWAGLPVLTRTGRTYAARVAASLLTALDLPELITSSLAHYELLAIELATKPSMLAAIREKLARNRLTSPLFDTDRLRSHIEAAYATMWERRQRGEPPGSFHVPPLA